MIYSKDINLLREDVRENCKKLIEICKERNLPILITNTVRDAEYQEFLYSAGRTRPGNIVTNSKLPSFHAYGLAFDFCKNVRGHEYDDVNFFESVAKIAKEMGFSWGGDWKSFKDMPHIQWDNGGKYSSAMVRNGSMPPMMPKFERKEMTQMYRTILDCPKWSQIPIQKAINAKILQGNDNGEINLSDDMVRIIVMLDRLGLFN